MSDLLIPVYLNQRIIFDLIAILQDGISTVTRLTTTEESGETNERNVGGTFGLSQAFSSLLKIDLSAGRSEFARAGSSASKSEERVHTPASLFHKVRAELRESEKLIPVNSEYHPKAGDIAEFSSILRRNPLVEFIDSFNGLLDIVSAFSDVDQPGAKKGQQQATRNLNSRSGGEVKKLKEQIGLFASGVKAGETMDVVSDDIGNGFKAVVTLQQEYLNDPSMADLVEGHFFVAGKIIRVVENADASVSLLRKFALSAMPPSTLRQAFGAIEQIKEFNLPRLEWQVAGPVVQLIPIAVYA